MSSRPRRIAVATAATIVFRAMLANAADPVAAEALFDQGRTLMAERRYPEACAKFEASQRLDPGVGTLLNLADCLERVGRTAGSWARFREAASAALSAGQLDREKIARERAAALEPRHARVIVRPSSAGSVLSGLSIVRDGAPIERDAWGIAVPVDPGRHTFEATAPGYRAWASELVVTEADSGRTLALDVPRLEPTGESSRGDAGSARRAIPLVVAGAGLVAIGAGTWLALDAKQAFDDASRTCTADGCPDAAVERGQSAGTRADVATGLLIGGAVAFGVGIVMYLLAPSR